MAAGDGRLCLHANRSRQVTNCTASLQPLLLVIDGEYSSIYSCKGQCPSHLFIVLEVSKFES